MVINSCLSKFDRLSTSVSNAFKVVEAPGRNIIIVGGPTYDQLIVAGFCILVPQGIFLGPLIT